jgi:ATP-dependent Lhr-like helicase
VEGLARSAIRARVEADAAASEVVDFLITNGFLVDDGGILGIGQTAEASLGRQHFMELLSVFTSPPVFSVRHGRVEIGLVPDETLMARPSGLAAGGAHVLVLAGRSWEVTHIDWQRRVAQVEPTDAPGVARWSGAGQPLGAVVARGVREVLAGGDPRGVVLSERAARKLMDLRSQHPWVRSDSTTLVVDDRGRAKWWTFAGWRANLWLAQAATELRREVGAVDDLTVALDPSATVRELKAALHSTSPERIDLSPWVVAEAVEGLKFSDCLPDNLALEVVTRRLADPASTEQALREELFDWRVASGSL